MIPNDTRFTGHPGPGWEQSMRELMEGKLAHIDFWSQTGSYKIVI
jgi:hypothetical protein